jgi:hypothetical protein
MTACQAVLDTWSLTDGNLRVRFTQASGEAPVVYVEVSDVEKPSDVEHHLGGIEPFNEELSVTRTGLCEVTIKPEYDPVIVLRGAKVEWRTSALEAADFERTVRLNEEWGKSQHEAWAKANTSITEAKHLLVDQRRRLVEKSKTHAPESTARLLYDQQISFIDRVLSKLDT